jgi:endogenous inhibitor of DNA gyrase (YacG/DUF329 family)
MRVKLIPRPPWRGSDSSDDPGTSLPPPDRAPLGGRCPACRREIVWPENPHRPFCSATCRLIDLGVWLDEGYRIPDPSAASEPAPDDRGPGGG